MKLGRKSGMIPVVAAMIVVPSFAFAQTEPSDSGGKKPAKSETKAAKQDAVKTAAVMQLKLDGQGDLAYRFMSPNDNSAPPTPMPAATNGIVALPVPSGFTPGASQLEILDNAKGNLARIPLATGSVVPVMESSFQFVQVVYVPVVSKGKPIADAQVTLTSKNYKSGWLLRAGDNGVARFENVPLDAPITVAVSYSANPPKSVTETLPRAHPADGYHREPLTVDWADVKFANGAATAANPAAPAPGTSAPEGSPAPANGTSPAAATPPPASTPIGGSGNNIFANILSLLVLAGIGYGAYWAYMNGKFKTFFEKAGIPTEPVAAAASAPNPFTKPERAPVQPITDGTADPFGGARGAMDSLPPLASEPRLVGTMGTYSGQIFPLDGGSVDIGRDTTNPIALPNDTNVSRRHASVQGSGGQFQIVDNGSSNGTYINGIRLSPQTPQTLRPGDEVSVGNTRFRFEA